MIYLVEDDDNIRELVVYTLAQSGLKAEGFALPHEFYEACVKESPRLVLLDIMLPEEDGLSILRKLRADPATKKLPVMMLTAKGSEYDKVVGLDQGADDYLPKPFGMMELLARVKALLRRSEGEQSSTEYRVGALYVSPERHQVSVGGEAVALTKKEFDILLMLLQNRGIVLSRDKLLSTIWGYDFDGENRTVDVHIRTLRSKLGEAGAQIETVRGIGYRIR
ncbi:MAG: response regulator transcription factor [Lachnospiraceae bacterium]|nr:response regulator transcription factor [Lachnospiraceae bacterium]